MLHNLHSLAGILRVNQYGSMALLMLDSDSRSCDDDESNQYQEMEKVEMILKKKVTIMTLKITNRKIVTMIVTFSRLKA